MIGFLVCILPAVLSFNNFHSFHGFHKTGSRGIYSQLKLQPSPEDASIHRYVATCIPGLATILAEELTSFGAQDATLSGSSAVEFNGSMEVGLKCLLHVRTAHKLMEWISTSDNVLSSRDDIHEFIQQSIDVKQLFGNGSGGLLTMSVSVIANGRMPADLRHTHFTALTIKNAICDTVRNLRGDRPDVDLDHADVPLVGILRGVSSEGAELSLYRCLHPPGSLHRRGYRKDSAIHKAAMKESLAAGLLLHAGWKEQCQSTKNTGEPLLLVDPMGGSGSLVIEAVMIAANLAPGLMRIKCGLPGHQIPPVLRWKSGTPLMETWKALLKDATQDAREGLEWITSSNQVRFIMNDIHEGALEICSSSLEQAGLAKTVTLRQGDCKHLDLADKQCFIVTNPPWGVRLTDEMEESWESLRSLLRSCAPGTEAWILSGNKEATKHLGLRRSQSIALKTADQDLRWLQYKISDISRKPQIDLDGNEDLIQDHKIEPYRSLRKDFNERNRFEKKEIRKVQRNGKFSQRDSGASGYKARVSVNRDQRQTPRRGDSSPLTDEQREERRNSWSI